MAVHTDRCSDLLLIHRAKQVMDLKDYNKPHQATVRSNFSRTFSIFGWAWKVQ